MFKKFDDWINKSDDNAAAFFFGFVVFLLLLTAAILWATAKDCQFAVYQEGIKVDDVIISQHSCGSFVDDSAYYKKVTNDR